MTSWTMCEVRVREVERRASGVARPRATWWESWWHVHEPGQPDEEKFFGSPCGVDDDHLADSHSAAATRERASGGSHEPSKHILEGGTGSYVAES